jgi:hypothetical protein
MSGESNGRTRPENRNGNFSPKTLAWMGRRSELFAQMTQGKNRSMVYGAITREKRDKT